MKTEKDIVELLGRKMTPIEIIIYNSQKAKKDYIFSKDKNGNLKSTKI